MEFANFTEYCAHVSKHCDKSEETIDADSKLYLQAMTECWQLLADKSGQKEAGGRARPF